MRLFTYPIANADPANIFPALASLPYSLWFDSARAGNPHNKTSYLCWQPFEIIESKEGRTRVTNREFQFSFDSDPFDLLQARLGLWAETMAPADATLPAFQGGAAGYFGYDLARQIERLPSTAATNELPDMAIGLYDQVMAYDHDTQTMTLIIHAADEKTALVKKELVFSYAQKKSDSDLPGLSWKPDCSDEAYKKKIERVIDYIEAGDIFQACLSRRFSAPRPQSFDSFSHYQTLRATNPAPFGGYMNFGDFQLGSSSPERFLKVDNRVVETRPIKGTRKAHADEDEDALIRDGLLTSEKDRAENAMIVDLLRNDLSKVCEDHSINVPVLCGLESYEGLHHLVSVVSGTLRADQSAVDLMRACFPGGSITGAPKVRAMEIIEELEPNRRGPWCGSMGWISFNGAMDSNIAIRTIVYERDMIHLQAGSGIVADSIAEDELNETLIKSDKLFESFDRKITRHDLAHR